jgi:hypothetical protein
VALLDSRRTKSYRLDPRTGTDAIVTDSADYSRFLC